MTTQELIERLRNRLDPFENGPDEFCRYAASRLSDLDAENKRLREALKPQQQETKPL